MNKRIDIQKTYKLYIDGKFPRTESGRYIKWTDKKETTIVNICRGSRKDFRNAMVSARGAVSGWSSRTAYNRAQILYRIGEMLEGRRDQFMAELTLQGLTKKQAENEIDQSIDRLIYYAGWADKFQQVFSRVNPVSLPYFNFTVPEATGVVAAIAPDDSSLLGLVSIVAPIISGGNSVVILASESFPLCSISFGEVLQTSDVPGGVINILTGYRSELVEHFSSHMDVNAIIYCGDNVDDKKLIETNAALNVKRVVLFPNQDWANDQHQSPYHILKCQETKTTWHPIGV
ncbi:MAG: aldehyde dehydrogenase family protein [Candidatus Marinimicrobia bacterium]|jgi:acyl-CoA reductase-like NAD-dependent aldehyde dehydrogenase|nr:aldehyde dehydrogenase family protein [Candidatus Neomarinimicrobiota bacterium]MBT3840037.1 aldehyde dehydrogenase family protein [Candidatus Neomarinimicrobiota bacterium]MBT4000069.1 aldehyde dehydrogenase family protein [Candidatus Neomarinimicrobiota bacterium]MBT4282132.1 aldehyde dehydrogenase family protein [Candidatus Neomarinimicrobiota bacterium]MBT4578871.1 aldehyde dehydrogenase family protein [Candidatus Neomarinimicrobiota bacterium]